MAIDYVELLNTVRDNASAQYQARVPEATRGNLEETRLAMLSEENIAVANEFMSTIVNKFAKSVVHTRLFANPLKTFKKGKKPLGDVIEEIYTNFIKAVKHNNNAGASLMERSLPDTKTVYHRMNRQDQYPITVTRADLSKAFSSYDELEKYITGIIDQLYNSSELDEFILMKQLIEAAVTNKAVKEVSVADPNTSEQNGRDFIKAVKTASGLMAFPNSDWNGYLTAQSTDTKPIITFSRKNEQILLLDTATDISVSVDVLASTFNMSVADFNDTRKVVIDAFPVKNVRAALVDEAFFQVYDDFFGITEWFNPKSLYTNYYLNVWQTMAYSPLVNAVVFTVPEA